MLKDYTQFLAAKLYLIESISLKGKLQKDETLSKIHDICLCINPEQIEQMIRETHTSN